MGKRNRLSFLGCLVLAMSAAAQESGSPRNRFQASLPVVSGGLEIPAPFRLEGPREADGRRAFREFAENGHVDPALGRVLQRLRDAPATFHVGMDPDSQSFLGLVSLFAEPRLLEPTIATASRLIGFQTWRKGDPKESDPAFEGQMDALANFLEQTVKELNAQQPEAEPMRFSDWSGEAKSGGKRRVLVVQVGRGARRLSILTHVDTVAPVREDWGPFSATLAAIPFRGTTMLFLTGRGSIDDKGPTAVALHSLDVLRSVYSGTSLFDRCTFELIADTSEETGAAIPDYFAVVAPPEAGVVLDAVWSVIAEKGSQRTLLRVPSGPETPASGPRAAEASGLRLISLTTPAGPANQIPDRATAVFSVEPSSAGQAREQVAAAMADHLKADNERARLELSVDGDRLTVLAIGSGAAHGSAPAVNKEAGHNPLACLAVFVANLHDAGLLEASDPLGLPLFLAWAFGHNVYGEDHPELLAAKDPVFSDGTTYALTRLVPTSEGRFEAKIDIRYTLAHHSTAWDGKTYGMLEGESLLGGLLTSLVERFNSTLPAELSKVEIETKTGARPDLKDPDSPAYAMLRKSFEAVVGKRSPLLAIGGGTDAKGFPMLFAAGPNFSTTITEMFDPPVNYHGIGESAPVEDLIRSGQILVRWMAVAGFAGD